MFKYNIHRIVDDLPLDELRKIFECKKINPFSEESKRKIEEYHQSRDYLLMLQRKDVIIFESILNI